MAGRDLTTALPPELVRRFFQDCTFDELHPLLGVCTRWRAIGLDHPTYWRSIQFSDFTEGAIHRALLRIERTFGRPFSLSVWAHRSEETISHILSVISTCLERLVKLKIFLPGVHAATALEALLHPAPRLETLHLDCPGDRPAALTTVPSGLFARHAPLLRSLRLYGSHLVEPLEAFRPVSDVFLTVRPGDDAFLPCAFTHFPSARRLTFTGCAALSTSQRAPEAFWSGLDSLKLCGAREDLSSAIRDLPLHAIRNILIQPGSSQFDYVCSLLHGELDLALVSDHDFEDHTGMFVLQLTERSTQRRRMFADHWCWWEEGTSSPNLYDLHRFSIADRFTTFSLSADILPAACARLPPLPNVVEITVMFHYWGFSGATPVQPLVVPKLRSLKLRGHDELPTVPASFLRDMCTHAFVGYVAPLVLTVERVIIPRHGDALESLSEFAQLS
ncbi:hypothetical protein EXIGLDRAFT_724504 [Exidia glandulosa HHB12029]|uniref:F-box domain-containing protein n=1 Tax=Exidia glandulosa HHB12029 TaxID=1314781 RepID=A0A165EDG5_EXIGL|nr:hypothetical protein EXIGLDRAFT_724504 [Exidia glandulosa HHB12029]